MSKFEIHKCILYISMVMILLYAIHVACLGICTYSIHCMLKYQCVLSNDLEL